MEAHDFRVCFTPLAGVLFTVPSRYCALSVAACSLPWTVVSPASDQVLRARPYSGTELRSVTGGYATITPSGAAFQAASPTSVKTTWDTPASHVLSYNPMVATAGALTQLGFRRHPVRSPLLRVWFSLPPATEMFQLAGCPPGQCPVPPRG